MRERGHDLRSSNINRVIKLGRVRWMEHAVRI